MQYRRLGKAGIKVSAISLGSWITYGGTTEDQMAVRTVRRALDLGVNHFDTADMYQMGRADEVLARALKGVSRWEVVLATKVFWPIGNGPNDRGLSRKHIVESFERSLKRLGTDYVDILYCHRFDSEVEIDEPLRAIDDLITSGKVLYCGISEWSAVQIQEACRIGRGLHLDPLAVDQLQYNLVHRGPEAEVLPVCREMGIGVIAFSPLAQGLLTGKYRAGDPAPDGTRGAAKPRILDENVLRRVERLRPVAEGAGIPLAHLALAWLLAQPGLTSALVGASVPEQIEQNVAALDVAITPDLGRAIEQSLAG